MRHHAWIVGFAVACSTHVHGEGLRIASRTAPAQVSDATIVGRATCQQSAWLLTDGNELIEVRNEHDVIVHNVAGLQPRDRPWGIACLNDGTLWTMASPRDLVRIDRTGRVQERLAVPLPRIALFAFGDRLLFQPMPIARGAAALMTSPARQPAASTPWPGLTSRGASTREAQLAQNLVTCGIADRQRVPCWFIDQMEFTISDGVVARSVRPAETTFPALDRGMPIRDVALAADGWFWYLVGGREAGVGRPSGLRLLRARETAGAALSIDLSPGGRVLLSATDSRCRLLLTDGSIVDVVGTL